MGSIRFRRSIKIAPGVKLNLTKTGVGMTVGRRGAHYSVHSSGRRTVSVGLPGSGLYYQNRSPARPGSSAGRAAASTAIGRPITPVDVVPRPGVLASKVERNYDEGVMAYLRQDAAAALAAFDAVLAENPRLPSAHLFAATSGDALDRPMTERIGHLEAVVQGDAPMPDAMQSRYLPARVLGLSVRVRITDSITVTLPLDAGAAALMLAEDYQASGRLSEAIGLAHQLHELNPADPTIRLSLADLLLADGDADGVLEATSTAQNDGDVGVALLQFRAAGQLLLGHRDGAIATLTEALAKTAARDPDLLKAVRYDRALALNHAGRASRSRADLERIYAQDPQYEDVAARLGVSEVPTTRPQAASTAPPEHVSASAPISSTTADAVAARVGSGESPSTPPAQPARPTRLPVSGWVLFYAVLLMIGVGYSLLNGYQGDLFWLVLGWMIVLGVLTRLLGLRPPPR